MFFLCASVDLVVHSCHKILSNLSMYQSHPHEVNDSNTGFLLGGRWLGGV
jgi:hypothetical protein